MKFSQISSKLCLYIPSNGYYVAYMPIQTSMYLIYIHLNKIYSFLFLCDVYNKVHEHIQ